MIYEIDSEILQEECALFQSMNGVVDSMPFEQPMRQGFLDQILRKPREPGN